VRFFASLAVTHKTLDKINPFFVEAGREIIYFFHCSLEGHVGRDSQQSDPIEDVPAYTRGIGLGDL